MIAASKYVLSKAHTNCSFLGVRKGTYPFPTPLRCSLRPQARLRTALGALSHTGTRVASTSTKSGASHGVRKPAHPERLMIYHAGTGRTTFLACLKLTTIFAFAFFDLLVTPAYLASDHPLWQAAGIFLCGTIPLASVAYLTGPFVTMIHIRLPPFTRQSREVLTRWLRSAGTPTATTAATTTTGSTITSGSASSPAAPSAAEALLDITTMSLIGKPRISTVRVADLRPARERLGVVNYARDGVRAANAALPWWRFRAVGKFGVTPGGEGRVPSGWVWTEVAAAIQRRAAAATGKTGR